MTEKKYIKKEQKLTRALAELPEQYVRECILENKIPDKILDEDFEDSQYDDRLGIAFSKGTKFYKIPNTYCLVATEDGFKVEEDFGTLINDQYFMYTFKRNAVKDECPF